MNRIIHFLKYHNLVPIVLGMISIVAVSALAASPQVREAFVSSQDIPRSIDNSGIIVANLENFNFDLQIKSITEDAENYYIVYTYQTIYIQDYIWQPVQREKTLTVPKAALGEKDLGLYAAEELSEVINYELSYLKEVQILEKEKGLTQKIVATEYAGLIGRFLSPEEKVFPGYEPVVSESLVSQPKITGEYTPFQEPSQQITEEQETESIQEQPEQQTTQVPVDRELIRQIVQEILSQQNLPDGQSPSETPPVCQPSEEICDSIDNDCDNEIDEGGICEEPPVEEPPAEESAEEPAEESTEELVEEQPSEEEQAAEEEPPAEEQSADSQPENEAESETETTPPAAE